jgi:hypothetical protein
VKIEEIKVWYLHFSFLNRKEDWWFTQEGCLFLFYIVKTVCGLEMLSSIIVTCEPQKPSAWTKSFYFQHSCVKYVYKQLYIYRKVCVIGDLWRWCHSFITTSKKIENNVTNWLLPLCMTFSLCIKLLCGEFLKRMGKGNY